MNKTPENLGQNSWKVITKQLTNSLSPELQVRRFVHTPNILLSAEASGAKSSKYSLECAEGSKSIHFQVVEVIGSLSVGLN